MLLVVSVEEKNQGRIMGLNSCLPSPKGQDISYGSGQRTECWSVISIPETDLSVIIEGTAVRACGEKDQLYFPKIQGPEKLGLF